MKYGAQRHTYWTTCDQYGDTLHTLFPLQNLQNWTHRTVKRGKDGDGRVSWRKGPGGIGDQVIAIDRVGAFEFGDVLPGDAGLPGVGQTRGQEVGPMLADDHFDDLSEHQIEVEADQEVPEPSPDLRAPFSVGRLLAVQFDRRDDQKGAEDAPPDYQIDADAVAAVRKGDDGVPAVEA